MSEKREYILVNAENHEYMCDYLGYDEDRLGYYHYYFLINGEKIDQPISQNDILELEPNAQDSDKAAELLTNEIANDPEEYIIDWELYNEIGQVETYQKGEIKMTEKELNLGQRLTRLTNKAWEKDTKNDQALQMEIKDIEDKLLQAAKSGQNRVQIYYETVCNEIANHELELEKGKFTTMSDTQHNYQDYINRKIREYFGQQYVFVAYDDAIGKYTFSWII